MARSNKYTPLNFNGIFEKKLSSSNNPIANNSNSSARSFANQSKIVLSNSRIHGNMLVLSRPSSRPITVPQNLESKDKGISISSAPTPDLAAEPDAISLRPQGRAGSVSTPIASAPIASPVPSQVKSDRFVPPHLRPGFVAKEEKPGPELVKGSKQR